METRTVVDQMGRTVLIPAFPQRIVSLVPSQTELLFDLVLDDRVVGITKFCVHPQSWFRSKTRVGGTKGLNMETVKELKPDLIIANKEENNREDIEQLEREFPVWVSDVTSLDSAKEMIGSVSEITNSDASQLISEIESEFSSLNPHQPTIRTLYLIWRKPYMAAGSDTFVNEMMCRCGLENVLASNRYPELSAQEIIDLNPQLVLLSSEPFPFKETDVEELQRLLPSAKIVLVDGELFSWYGSRLRFSPRYFQHLIFGLK